MEPGCNRYIIKEMRITTSSYKKTSQTSVHIRLTENRIKMQIMVQ